MGGGGAGGGGGGGPFLPPGGGGGPLPGGAGGPGLRFDDLVRLIISNEPGFFFNCSLRFFLAF